MAYVKTIWENLPSESTPINASNLNKIENGIYDNSVNIETINTNISNINDELDTITTYSTDEQVIGTWIDGKPLYSRRYSKTISSGTQNDLLTINRNDYGVIWVNMAFSDSSNSKSIISNYYYQSNDFQRVHIEQGNRVIFQRGSSYPVLPLTVYYELRYTKASD